MTNKSYPSKRYIKDSNIVFRKIGNEFILVPIKQNARDVDNIYTVNAVGSRIWELIDGKKSIEEIVKMIMDDFEVSPEEARNDLLVFLEQLQMIGAVRMI